jgi:uncharacterized protein (DUF58 family)
METSELLKKVRKIEIKTRGVSRQLFAGEYHSVFKGRGMSFSEVREYQPGDDIRSIDWNVTARLNHPYVKVFEEERELTTMLMVDVSGSSFFGAYKQFKNELITEMCAVLAFSAINNNDKVGVIFFTDKIEKFIPPKKGRSHILRIIRELLDLKPSSNGTDVGAAITYLNNVLKKRSIVFVISDFMVGEYEQPLKIAGRKHDLIGFHIYDRREEEIPNIGLIKAKDAETGKLRWLDTSDKYVRDAYMKHYKENFNYFKYTFLSSGGDIISVSTTDNYISALMAFFKKREKRK